MNLVCGQMNLRCAEFNPRCDPTPLYNHPISLENLEILDVNALNVVSICEKLHYYIFHVRGESSTPNFAPSL